MTRILTGMFLIVLLVALSGYLYYTRTKEAQEVIQNNAENTNPEGNQVASPAPSLSTSNNSFTDPNEIFSVLYPPDYELDTSDPAHPRIVKRGETQRSQTELYDGALIVFESVALGNQTLSSFLDKRINDATQNGMQEVIKPKSPTMLNNYPGYSYTLRGLGETTYTVIQKDTNSDNALIISTLVADPENKGYQTEVDATLNSITLLK